MLRKVEVKTSQRSGRPKPEQDFSRPATGIEPLGEIRKGECECNEKKGGEPEAEGGRRKIGQSWKRERGAEMVKAGED